MSFWRLSDARLIQERLSSSAVAGLTVGTSQVPEGKCWVILACGLMPDAAETRVISFVKITASGATFSLLNPVSLALNPQAATFIEQGMEYLLFPGEYIQGQRNAATAGSTLNIRLQIIEIDLPLYVYDEPHIVRRQTVALSSIRERLGGGSSGGGGIAPRLPTRGGRGGGPLPV